MPLGVAAAMSAMRKRRLAEAGGYAALEGLMPETDLLVV